MEHAEETGEALLYSFNREGEWESEEQSPAHYRPEIDPYWYLQYQTDIYDWSDPEWVIATRRGKNAWRAIPLWKRRPGSNSSHDVVPSGYFAAVSAGDYKRLTQHPDGARKRWGIQIKYSDEDPARIIKMYAIRYGRSDEPKTVMMHREVVGCLHRRSVTDHYNGCGLDNRRENLAETTQAANMANSRRERTRNTGLPVGVEMRKYGGEIRYGGIRAKRLAKRRVKIYRSKRTWKTPWPAAAWYQNQLKKLHGVRPWVHRPRTLSYPLFPPKLESTPSRRSSRLRSLPARKTSSKKDAGKKRTSSRIPF